MCTKYSLTSLISVCPFKMMFCLVITPWSYVFATWIITVKHRFDFLSSEHIQYSMINVCFKEMLKNKHAENKKEGILKSKTCHHDWLCPNSQMNHRLLTNKIKGTIQMKIAKTWFLNDVFKNFSIEP